MARPAEFQCEVTKDGLQARAAPYGGDISKLPPPDGLFQPGDQYTSASGCSRGDVTLSAGKGAPASSGTSPVVIGVIAVGVIVLVAVLVLLWRRYQRQFDPYSGRA